MSRLQQKTLQARLTLAPLKRTLVSEATPLVWNWLFSKTEVLLDCYQRGAHYPRRPIATLLWCKSQQSKRCTSIHFVQSRNCDNLLSSLCIYFMMVCNNWPLDWDVMAFLICHLGKFFLAWRQEDQVLPKTLDES